MTSAQKVMVKNWVIGCVWLVAFAVVFQLPHEYRLKTGLVLGVLFSLWPLLNPEIRNWRGYGSEQQSLGDFIGRHGLLKLWMVGYCALVLPFLIYRIATLGGDSIGSYLLCFLLLVGPPFLVSEYERYQAAG